MEIVMRPENKFMQNFSLVSSFVITIMSTTIQQGLRPLFLMCFIMGLGVYPIKQPTSRFQWIAYLSILYFFTIWIIYGYVLFFIFTIFPLKFLYPTIFTRVMLAIDIFTAITSAILIFYHHKRFQIYMKKLAAVDDTLQKLGTCKMYQKLHIFSRVLIIGWIVHALINNIYDTIWFTNSIKEELSWIFLLVHVINHPTHINEFTDLLFIFLLWYIGTRFDKLNDHIQCLLLKEEYELKYMWKKPVIIHKYFIHRHNYKRTSWTLMHLYLELCRIAHELNVIFGLQITFGMVYNFGILSSICYYFCCTLLNQQRDKELLEYFIGFGFWFFSSFIKFYAVNHICQSVKNKANNIHKITYQLTSTLRYADIWNEIYFFVLQVMHHPLKFSGLGFFYLGYKILLKSFCTIVTFVIIMLQLNIQVPYP